MPVFKTYEPALIRRFLIVEFKTSFNDSDKQITNLDKLIIADDSEIEWFIYNSIKAYKDMVEDRENFIFKITDDETMELVNKHTPPLNHIIRELILKHDPKAYDTEKSINRKYFKPVFTNDLVDVILLYSEKFSIDVPTDKHGKINKKKLLNVIKEEFDLYDGEMIDDGTGDYNHLRDYKAQAERWTDANGTSKRERAYPNLIATPLYIELLNELKAQQRNKNN